MVTTSRISLGTGQTDSKSIHMHIDEQILHKHFAIFGGTGQGKSKLCELLCRQLMLRGRGLAFLDPHTQTADDLLRFCTFFQELIPAERVVYLNPAVKPIAFDPFQYHCNPYESAATKHEHSNWLAAKIQDMVRIILRTKGETEDEQEKQVRLKTWLRNGLYAVGTPYDDEGNHHCLADLFALINPLDPRHESLYRAVADRLPADVRSDFEMIRGIKAPEKLQQFIESTLNVLREMMSPIMRAIFSRHAQNIDFRNIVQSNGIILGAFGKTETFHEDWGKAVAGLILREITGAVRTTNVDQRGEMYLLIDEAQDYMNDDIKSFLRGARKFKLSLGLAMQELDSLRKGEADLISSVLNQTGFKVTFQQQFHRDAEVFAKSMLYSHLDFTKLIHEVERDAGYEWTMVSSYSRGNTHSDSRSISQSVSAGQTEGLSFGGTTGTSIGRSYGTTHTEGASETQQISQQVGRTQTHSESEGTTSGFQLGESGGRVSTNGQSDGRNSKVGGGYRRLSTNEGSNHSIARNEGWSEVFSSQNTHQSSTSNGTSIQLGLSQSHGVQESDAFSWSHSGTDQYSETTTLSSSNTTTLTEGQQTGQTDGTSHSITFQPTPLHQTKRESQDTGQFEIALSDQHLMHTHQIQSLNEQHCLVSIAKLNLAYVLRVADVVDPFLATNISEEAALCAIANYVQSIYSVHNFYFELHDTDTAAQTDASSKPEMPPGFRQVEPPSNSDA